MLIINLGPCVVDIAEWERVWDVNIRGTIFCYKHAARQMVKQGNGGRIIGEVPGS